MRTFFSVHNSAYAIGIMSSLYLLLSEDFFLWQGAFIINIANTISKGILSERLVQNKFWMVGLNFGKTMFRYMCDINQFSYLTKVYL